MAVWRTSRPHGWRHASDEMLMLLALAGADASDPALADHVTACDRCGSRLVALRQALTAEQEELAGDADRVFTPVRLERQRAAILRRIGGSRASARILPFPAFGLAVSQPRRQVLRRSVAAAAITGLIIGAAAGRLLDPHRQPFQLAQEAETRNDEAASLRTRATLQASVAAEEAFLREFEAALGTPRVGPLLALDELTPRPVDDASPR